MTRATLTPTTGDARKLDAHALLQERRRVFVLRGRLTRRAKPSSCPAKSTRFATATPRLHGSPHTRTGPTRSPPKRKPNQPYLT